ncbi:helix-turn-helix domain-containing protein [Spartinivicinus ruber]|uniref:helix-turn-helix domain-containing protein n=1 Tax=Spartinivicinus ruber TaxID=2683272 RepID=UPI0013D3AEF5|nr:helix-turn-helix domain-containing protein [Spartinivicinus ruber]
MYDVDLFSKLLSLEHPWYIPAVHIDEQKRLIYIFIDFRDEAHFSCPICGESCSRYDKRTRKWRHLDTCDFKTYITAMVPRVNCSNHGCHSLMVDWANPRSRFTTSFEERVVQFSERYPIASLSRKFAISWTAVNNIVKRLAHQPNFG